MRQSTMTLKRAQSIAGSLGKPSKMPGYAYGISADQCITGAKLAKIEGTPCFTCYAKKANYQYPSVRVAHAKRLEGLFNPDWIPAMVKQISNTKTGYFRWFDSGDIQGLQNLINIVKVCEALPDVKFWLPTQERKIVSDYLATFGAFPDNLIVRVSASKVNGTVPNASHSSMVVTDNAKATCRAFENKNKCGDCRACWDKSIKTVSYLQH